MNTNVPANSNYHRLINSNINIHTDLHTNGYINASTYIENKFYSDEY